METRYPLLKIILLGSYLLIMSCLCFVHKEEAFSSAERRPLAASPEFTYEAVLLGDFQEDFSAYCLDQFPYREPFRRLKAYTNYNLFGMLDQNHITVTNGFASQHLYPQQDAMLSHAGACFTNVYELYLKENSHDIYLGIIPDKNLYLDSAYPSMDYPAFVRQMESLVPFAASIPLLDTFQLESYYRTDTHIRQEAMIPAANRILSYLNPLDLDSSTQDYPWVSAADYSFCTLDVPFYGVYYGQSALPLAPDTITYLTNPTLEDCIVTNYDTGSAKPGTLYDFSKAEGKDPYEFFLSGSVALTTIENPAAKTTKELLLFRDSFGSSLAPLLVPYYAKITVIDLRYVHPAVLEHYISFTDQDVLFLYSTLLLNQSTGLKK